MSKQELRSKALAARSSLEAPERHQKESNLVAEANKAFTFSKDDIVSGFWPIRGEPNILSLLEDIRDKGAVSALPVVIDKETIIFRRFNGNEDLEPAGFGTKAPGPSQDEVLPTIMLVPLAAFDENGNRIGYGAGFYDRAIANLRKKGMNPRLIGIAFDCQEVSTVPAEEHDIPLDYILTESGCRTIYS